MTEEQSMNSEPTSNEPAAKAGDIDRVDKMKSAGMNRKDRRAFDKDLAAEVRRATMPDMAKAIRAKRTAKRREAAKVKNKNRSRK